MPVDTEDIIEKDEDLKATEQRIIELRQKKERTPEEEKEFKDLRQHHRGRVEEQILSERERAQRESERAAKAEQALEDARARLKEIEEKRDIGLDRTTGGGENETEVINGKTYYTEEAIALRCEKGLMSRSEGWNMQKEKIEENTIEKIEKRAPKQKAEDEWKAKRMQSLEEVKKEGYGWMIDSKDPKHNPNDPLFKEANKLWNDGLQYDPDGPRKALEYAKRMLGKDVPREDRADDFGIPKNNAASDSNSQREKKVSLSEIEQQNATRWWTTINNPKTGKNYTESEALQKALEAKRKRMAK